MYSSEVDKLLNKYNLAVIKPFRIADGGFKRSFVLLCEDKHGAKKVLKIFASSDNNAKNKFIREVKILSQLGEIKRLVEFVPKVYQYNLEDSKGSLYYILEYFSYKSFGEFTKDAGYQTGILKKASFEEFMEFWHNVNNYCQDGFEWLSEYGFSRFMGELSFYKANTPNILSSVMWEKVFRHLKAREKIINNYKVLSHLDLYPENLFVKEPFLPDFKIIDWEQSHLIALGCNEAFLYLMFWKEDFFRKKIFARVWEQGMIGTFKCFLLLFSARFLYQTTSFVDKINPLRESFTRFLLSVINDITLGKFDRPKNLQYILDKNLVSRLLKSHYSIKEEIFCEDFPAGYGNAMVKAVVAANADNGKEYVFRVYSLSRVFENIRREAKIYRYLSKKGFPTYFIYKNKERRLVSKAAIYKRERYFILTSCLSGATVPRTGLKNKHIKQAGGGLAKMHKAGVVHNDYNRRNVLYDKGVLSGIIDMEFSRFTTSASDHLRDLAKALALWMQGIDNNCSLSVLDVYQSFMGGYFGKSWEAQSAKVSALVVKELRKLGTEYKKMYKESPSEYFRKIISFINTLIQQFKSN